MHAWPRYKVLYLASRGKWKLHGIFETRREADMVARDIQRDGYKTYVVQEGAARKNPRKTAPNDLKRAASLYKRFTGKNAPEPRKLNVPSFTKAGVVFGTLFGVGYISERDGKPYQHTFRAKSRPLLIASSDGKSVLIFGGRFAFTERGIVDK